MTRQEMEERIEALSAEGRAGVTYERSRELLRELRDLYSKLLPLKYAEWQASHDG